MKDFLALIFSCLLGTCPASSDAVDGAASPQTLAHIQTQSGKLEDSMARAMERKTLSGYYLSSQFAQRHHDWQRAVTFTGPLLDSSPENAQLLNKTMVLAMGSGQTERAIELARTLLSIETEDDKSALALLFVALDHFSKEEYKQAEGYIAEMPDGSLSEFILPLLESWSKAAMGVHDTANLDKNTIHIHHAILIAQLMGETSNIEPLLQKSLSASGLALQDLERIADVYAYIGKDEIALELYQKLFDEWPDNRALGQKLDDMKSGKKGVYLKVMATPKDGMAEALYDMSRLLFQEYSDDSARVFAHMALFLNPGLTDANLLLGYITARNDQYDEAIAYYQMVKPDNPKYAEAQRMAADLLESTNQTDQALKELDALYKNQNDLEALIQMGDIYRRNEDFKKAVAKYNQAAKTFDGPIPKEYWQLYYVRGMSYERMGDWKKAELDLSAALSYQPENPSILNYLGYAWADQGVKLEQSLELIRKAAALRSTDGYIIDSLGWVLYRMDKNEEAVPHLEKAVELLPYDPIINDHLGDAYWKVGRYLEARFQWTRAQNYSEDESFISGVKEKLQNGLETNSAVKEAHSQSADDKI